MTVTVIEDDGFKDEELEEKDLNKMTWTWTGPDLIFVTNITNIISAEKIVMWRNFSFPCMTIVGKWKFLHMWRNFRCLHMTDVEKSEILHIWHVCDLENFAIYTRFHVEKNLAQSTFVEKKWQIWGLVIVLVQSL